MSFLDCVITFCWVVFVANSLVPLALAVGVVLAPRIILSTSDKP